MAYLMKTANASAMFLSTTTSTVVQTISWYSDPSAIYCLQWGGKLSCPTSIGGTCAIGVTFNGVAISLPAAMQTMTGTFIDFGNSFQSNCANQDSTGLNTLTMTAQLSAVTAGSAAKIRETFLEVTQTVPSSNFDQLVLPVPKLTGQCVIPRSFVNNGSKLVVALRSDAAPTPAVSTDSQSLVYNGVVFQYLTNNQTYIVHSEWCGGNFTKGSCSLQANLDGSLTFKRSKRDMQAWMEEWTFRSLPSTITVLPITKVQPVFQDMYVKRNATSMPQLQQQYQSKIDQLLSNLSGRG